MSPVKSTAKATKKPVKKPAVKKAIKEEANYQGTPAPLNTQPSTNDVLMGMMQFLGKMNETQEKILEKLSNPPTTQDPAEVPPHEQVSSSTVEFEVYGEFFPKGDHMMVIEVFGRYRSREGAEKKLEEIKAEWMGVPYPKRGETYFFKGFDIKEVVIRTFETKNLA